MDPNVLHNISYGMFIVASNKDNAFNGQIANTVFQITSAPVTVAISINNKNLTYEYIKDSKHFSVSILEEDAPLTFIGKFGFKSGRQEDKFKDANFKVLSSGCPVITDYSIAYLKADVIKSIDCLTHTLFLGCMKDGGILKEGKPMTYDYYHNVKKGATPPKAPTFIRGESRKIRPAGREALK
ncbi:MAG: flavin reductase [Omnitrophica bacterium RIFCSPLOWO2_02_FULL_45_16]|nr:MAG: flavin reductase [Omnitrophica bacterium RIFCSPHIGHO2_02_FULL_46_20]OGW92752.1 MAG: flavin reductase [Omnitrophica bacterium RIFCSPLOWO2_12_FULL_45_13]OGW92986.1 MAG: flavin reductase [Omnitrophica bacterium RIFCSPLOWO2_01_FULL_45_24]OGW99771.1 MAG: flavin reductase [Omnitrophica bacterium RIFCSPLOWO2_02_FULL_45_16]